jgi:lipoate-protein ligase A
MEQEGVHLARRQSGGGAVYQDLGNTNFTIVGGADAFNKDFNYGILTDALARAFNLNTRVSGRNDLVLVDASGDEHKISGSAYKLTTTRSFHHGTMLLNVNLGALGSLLSPSRAKLISKGVKSAQARVKNLSEVVDIDHESFCHAVEDAFCRAHGVDPENVQPQMLNRKSTSVGVCRFSLCVWWVCCA